MNLIDSIVKDVHEKYGDESLQRMKSFSFNVDRISTQLPSLDTILGGGIPLGRITEIIGNEGAGKTTLGLHIMAECIDKGGLAMFIDVEHALNPDYIGTIIKDKNKLIICQPRDGEEAVSISLEVMRKKIEKEIKKPSVIVIDSIAALTTKEETSGDMSEKIRLASLARLLSDSLRILTPTIARSNTALVCLNQMRASIGSYVNADKSAGGKALKFYSSIRLSLSASSKRMGEDGFGSQLVKAKTLKNKTYKPLQEVSVELIFGLGFDKEKSLVDSLIEKGAITKRGNWVHVGERKFNSASTLSVQSRLEPELLSELKKMNT